VHHIHGVVNAVAWRVADQGAAAAGAFLACGISDKELAPEMRAGYPFPFEATLRFTLTGTQLSLLFTLENRGSEPLPFGYGLHPYFRAPLWDGTAALPLSSERSSCPVQIPAASRWPLEDGMPSGPARPVSPEDDLRQWRELGPEHFDHIFSDLTHENGWSSAGYRDPSSGLEVSVRADEHFREWVLYTQPNRPSLCIEPYTGLPNAANMASEGIDNGGLLTLEPGQTWRAEVVIEVSGM